MPRIVYSRHYNIGFYGLERLHPFDSRKYGRAWNMLKRHFGSSLYKFHVRPDRAATRDELLLVHTSEYVNRLRDPKYVAAALEVPIVRRLPSWAIDWHVLVLCATGLHCPIALSVWAMQGQCTGVHEFEPFKSSQCRGT